jgi:hypothetical protein
MIAGRVVGALAIAGAGFVLAGCGPAGSRPAHVVTVTVAAPSPSSSPSSSAPPTDRPAPTVDSTEHTVLRRLPGTCDSLLPLGTVIDALGRNIGGATAFVVGQPDPAEGKIGYLNCRYGIGKADSVAAVEIGVNLYRTAARAAARIAPTVDDFTAHGATAARTTVAGEPATVLTGGSGAGYGPTLVTAAGQRTVAVTVRAGTVPRGEVSQQLVVLAALAERRTG